MRRQNESIFIFKQPRPELVYISFHGMTNLFDFVLKTCKTAGILTVLLFNVFYVLNHGLTWGFRCPTVAYGF